MPVAGVRGTNAQPSAWTDAAGPRAPQPVFAHRPGAPDDQGASDVAARPAALPVRRSTARDPVRRRWMWPTVAAAVVVVGTFALLTSLGSANRKSAPLLAGLELDRLASLLGLALTQVQLSGHRFTTDTAIFDALELERVRSLFSFDALAARARIEKLPWVNTATIVRLLPDTLAITITERKPAAVWRTGDREILIDAGGRQLGGIRNSGAPDLPHIAGTGAPIAAAELFAHLARYPDIASRLLVAERVGERRWTLRLAGDLEVLLPSVLDARPFATLQRVVNGRTIIDTSSGQLDLRHADRIVAVPLNRPARLLAAPQGRAKQNG